MEFLLNNKEVIISLLLLFVATVFSTAIGTIKTIFVANKAGYATYIATIIDAMVYMYLVKSIVSSGTIEIVIYVLGRVVGAVLGDVLENKIAIGIYDIDIYIKDHETQKLLQEILIENDFSSTMNVGTISENNVRWYNNVQLKRKDMEKLYQLLEQAGITKPAMVIRQAKKVSGRIAERI